MRTPQQLDVALFWEQSSGTGVYADVMNEIPKVVFSKTLTRADWAESRIASGDLAEDIDRLKREPGGVIAPTAARPSWTR